jgi:hypothetical protein
MEGPGEIDLPSAISLLAATLISSCAVSIARFAGRGLIVTRRIGVPIVIATAILSAVFATIVSAAIAVFKCARRVSVNVLTSINH